MGYVFLSDLFQWILHEFKNFMRTLVLSSSFFVCLFRAKMQRMKSAFYFVAEKFSGVKNLIFHA